jgi:hypothetical protein
MSLPRLAGGDAPTVATECAVYAQLLPVSMCRLFQTRVAAPRIAEITGKTLIYGMAVGPPESEVL